MASVLGGAMRDTMASFRAPASGEEISARSRRSVRVLRFRGGEGVSFGFGFRFS